MEKIYKSVTINGDEISYFRIGKGEPLLLLHGALADNRMWNTHSDILAEDFDVIVPTQRHFGKNGPSDKPFGIETHTSDIITLLDQLEIDSVHVVAWSYGADIALNLATKIPNKLTSLYVYEPGFPGCLDDNEMKVFGADANEMFGPIFYAVQEHKLEEAVELLIDGSGNYKGYFQKQTEQLKREQLENKNSLPLQLSQSEQPNLDKEALSKITTRSRVAYGEYTRDLFMVVSNAVYSNLQNSSIDKVENATHMYPMEKPHEFSDKVKSFIQK
ncbi:alpha/beta fold hydrolase [Flammeovirga kamogawensis]|uniref:Alpha/beta hydrolase n=1 Tax=Flammeovirga kamogawensis TaxID=373891 RepID=A0ABX8GSK3_9BACT|nr:alpha/beta hydrolase [Flammeovirga kamogawensis]MBB6463913.1 pimeloyl-ACP methyl ester carboxylesterase [Flammeovirga kamogawensis]QWG06564.1 alpha/beta hydrolase [Flammeovirga kamogawensis]